MRKVNKRALVIAALLIVTIVIASFAFIQKQGPLNRLLGRLSPRAVSSISIYSEARPLREAALEEGDQNKLIKLLRKERYEGSDDLDAYMTGALGPNYSIRIQTKDGADILLVFTSKHCICRPDEFEGNATSKSEDKAYKISKDGNNTHQQVMDLLNELLFKYFPDDKVDFSH